MKSLSIKAYLHTLSSIIKEPKKFFRNLPENSDLKSPLSFLAVSLAISTVVFITGSSFQASPEAAAVYFINAAVMSTAASMALFAALKFFLFKNVKLKKCFSLFAYSAGATVIAAGVPFLLWMTEIWKWWLVGVGINQNLKIKPILSFIAVVLSIALVISTFASILYITGQIIQN
jgi:hypothetical protein